MRGEKETIDPSVLLRTARETFLRSHTPAPEIAALVNQLRQIPELREEVVREVAQRLACGDYSTPEALNRTVQAMLDSTRA
jgi:hypothetical protein